MKGVIMKKGDKKSIVLFNNGEVSSIPTPPHCEVGTVVTVSYNRKRIFFFVSLACILLLCFFFLTRFLYFTPAGFLRISYGGQNGTSAAIELTYNRMERITKIRPLTQNTAETATGLSAVNKKIPAAYREVITAFLRSPDIPPQNTVTVVIAQDNLSRAKTVEQNLSLLSSVPSPITAVFELYTIELYRKTLAEIDQDARPVPFMHDGEHGGGGACTGEKSGKESCPHPPVFGSLPLYPIYREVAMKKIILAVIITLAATGIGFAHGHHGNGHGGSAYNCSITGGHYHNGNYYNGHH
jgi:hypothetical protein